MADLDVADNGSFQGRISRKKNASTPFDFVRHRRRDEQQQQQQQQQQWRRLESQSRKKNEKITRVIEVCHSVRLQLFFCFSFARQLPSFSGAPQTLGADLVPV